MGVQQGCIRPLLLSRLAILHSMLTVIELLTVTGRTLIR